MARIKYLSSRINGYIKWRFFQFSRIIDTYSRRIYFYFPWLISFVLEIKKSINRLRMRLFSDSWHEYDFINENKPDSIGCIRKIDCIGCGNCILICPKNALTLKSDFEGFLYPEISETCTSCKRCLSVCPVVSQENSKGSKFQAYAALGPIDVRLKSSSGGVFPILASNIIERGGVVIGAAFDDFFHLRHIVATSQDELTRLFGSKYVQSDLQGIQREILRIVNDGRLVLFAGCPCQVAAVKKFLKAMSDKVIYLDLLCHGSPSPKIFEKYLNEIRGERIITQISFRDKEVFKWSKNMKISFSDGSIYRESEFEDAYLTAFLKSYSLRPHCGYCKYARIPRQGDITVGDFWEVGKLDESLDDGYGTSLVLINNEKGHELLMPLTERFAKWQIVANDVVMKSTQPYVKPAKYQSRVRREFFENIKTNTVRESVSLTKK